MLSLVASSLGRMSIPASLASRVMFLFLWVRILKAKFPIGHVAHGAPPWLAVLLASSTGFWSLITERPLCLRNGKLAIAYLVVICNVVVEMRTTLNVIRNSYKLGSLSPRTILSSGSRVLPWGSERYTDSPWSDT